jgi:hypothetical protein
VAVFSFNFFKAERDAAKGGLALMGVQEMRIKKEKQVFPVFLFCMYVFS